MKPLEALEKGVRRIQDNVLTEEIVYEGDAEFEEICDTFNEMQAHILAEQEKNRKYEKARTEMVAGLSHDLRTPLTAVRGTVKALMDGIVKVPEQQEKFLRTAYRRTGDMDVLLNQLFYLSKLETGNMPLHLKKHRSGPFYPKLWGRQERKSRSGKNKAFCFRGKCRRPGGSRPGTAPQLWSTSTASARKSRMTAEIRRFWRPSGAPGIGLTNKVFKICLENHLLFV